MTTAAPPPDKTNELLEMIAWTIAHPSSHAFSKHIKQFQEFSDENFPPVLKTPEDIRRHMAELLREGKTSVVCVGPIAHIYHRPTETMIVIDPAARANKDGGTIYRNDPPRGRQWEPWYVRRVKRDAERFGIHPNRIKEHKCSFKDFLKANPEFERSLREDMLPLYRGKRQLEVIARQRNGKDAAARVAAAARRPQPR